jgi:hypothetical protein
VTDFVWCVLEVGMCCHVNSKSHFSMVSH